MNTGQGNKTWDEFYQDAKKIHTLGDNYYITSDTGGAGFYDSMTWLASATPFSTEGETVTINLTGDPKVRATPSSNLRSQTIWRGNDRNTVTFGHPLLV